MEDIVVRHEQIWPIIWSQPKWKYFFSDQKRVQESIIYILSMLNNWLSLNEIEIDSKLLKELELLWFNWKIREIIPPNNDKPIFAPLEIYFDYTWKCNLRCSYCYNGKYLWTKTMSDDDVAKVFEEMYKLWIMRVHLAWWEPMSNEKWFRNYLEQAKKYWIMVSMATNWTLLTDNNIKTVLDNEIFSVTVSLDWWNAEINDNLRWKWSFDKAINWIKKLIQARDAIWSHMEVDIKPVFSIDTDDKDLEDLVLLTISLWINKIKFYNPERSLNHELWHYWKWKDEYYKKLMFLKLLQEKYKWQILIPIINNPAVNDCSVWLPWIKWCIWAQELLTINPDWRITPCLMDDYYLWNIHTDSWIESFLRYSEKLKGYLNKILSPECDWCKIYGSCRWWCQVRKIVEYWEIKWIDPLCPVNIDSNVSKEPDDWSILKPVYVVHSL